MCGAFTEWLTTSLSSIRLRCGNSSCNLTGSVWFDEMTKPKTKEGFSGHKYFFQFIIIDATGSRLFLIAPCLLYFFFHPDAFLSSIWVSILQS